MFSPSFRPVYHVITDQKNMNYIMRIYNFENYSELLMTTIYYIIELRNCES